MKKLWSKDSLVATKLRPNPNDIPTGILLILNFSKTVKMSKLDRIRRCIFVSYSLVPDSWSHLSPNLPLDLLQAMGNKTIVAR